MNINLNDAVIVDVRTPEEFNQDHFPGALNIPLDQISAHTAEIRGWKKSVVLYCRSGNRSGMAVSLLKQHGLTDVYNGGGLDDMKRAML